MFLVSVFLRGTYNHPFLVLTSRFFLNCESQVAYKVTFNVSVSQKGQFWSPLSVIQEHLYCTQTPHLLMHHIWLLFFIIYSQVIAKEVVYAITVKRECTYLKKTWKGNMGGFEWGKKFKNVAILL